MSPTSAFELYNVPIDEKEYIRILEEELLKGTFKDEATTLAYEGARKKYQEKSEPPSWQSPFYWPETEEEKREWFTRQIKGFEEAPETLRQLVIERPAQVVRGAIKAGIKREPIGEAVTGAFRGEEETSGQQILEAIGVEFASDEYRAEHPIQAFLWEMITFKRPTAAFIDLVTDPVLWGLWFSGPLGKLVSKAKSLQASGQIKQFANMLKTDLRARGGLPGPGVLKSAVKDILAQPKYSQFKITDWYKTLKPEPLMVQLGDVSGMMAMFSVPAEFGVRALATKSTPILLKSIGELAALIKGLRYKIEPDVATQWKNTLAELTGRQVKTEGKPVGEYYQEITSGIAPKAEAAATRNLDYNKEAYGIQLGELEEIPKDMENRFYGFLYEAAGDMFREVVGNGAGDYIMEKVKRIQREWPLRNVEKLIAGTDIQSLKQYSDVLNSISIETPRAKLVVELINNMIKGNDAGVMNKLDQIENLTKPEIAARVPKTLFPEEEMAKTRQMDMYKQELATLNEAGIYGKEAQNIALQRAGRKYLKETKAEGKQLEWKLGLPTLKGQKDFDLEASPEEAIKAVEDEAGESIEFKQLLGGVERVRETQNKDIEERVFLSGAVPDIYDQDLYIFNNTRGKHFEETEEKLAKFKELLEKNNPDAFNALSSGKALTEEELTVKIYALDNAIKKLDIAANNEWQGVRDALFDQQATPELETLYQRVLKEVGGIKYTPAMKDYPEEWKQFPVGVKRKDGLAIDEAADILGMDIEDLVDQLAHYKPPLKPQDFEEQAFNKVENKPDDYPSYARRAELQATRQRYLDRMLDLGAKMPKPKPDTAIKQTEVEIERISGEPEEDLWIPPQYTPGQIKAWGQVEWGEILGPFEGKYPVEIEGGKLTPGKAEQAVFDGFPPEDIISKVEPWDRGTDDVHWLAYIRRVDNMFSDYERATGVPIYSQGYRQIKLASQAMRQEEMVGNALLRQLWADIPEKRRELLGDWYIGEAPKDFVPTEGEKETLKAMENWFKYWGKEFGLPEERMLPKYLSRIFKSFAEGDPTLLPKDMQASFKKHRLKENPFKGRERDPQAIMQWYLHAGLRDKYLWESNLIPDFITHLKDQPIGIKKISERWIKHKILRHPTEFDTLVAKGFAKLAKLPGFKQIAEKWGVDAVTGQKQILRALTQIMYSSGIGFRGLSPTKNFTQQIHNLIILGPKYFFKGIAGAWTKDNRELAEVLNVLRNFGAQLEAAGIDNPATVQQKFITAGNKFFRLVDSNSRLAFLSGYDQLVTDRYADFQAGKIDKAEFFKKTLLDLMPYGIRAEVSKAFLAGDVETYKNIGAQELIKLGQYTYEPEDMPILFSGAWGRFASVFMTWPIEYAEMMGTFAKTGHWERFLYYYLAATATQNVLREMGIETNPYGYGDIEIGDHRISLIPGGWFLFGSAPTGLSPGLNILAVGGKALMVLGKGASDAYLNSTIRDLKQASKILIPYGLTASDMIDFIKEIQSGTYGRRNKDGDLLYISDAPEAILRALGFTTTTEARELGRYREPIYEIEQAREGYWTSPFGKMGQGVTQEEKIKQWVSPLE